MLSDQHPYIAPNVLVNGTFNIIHAGHIELFKYASSYGNLIVAVNDDPYLLEKYGSKAITIDKRLSVIESIKYVSETIVFDEDNCCRVLELIKPDIYIKGPDYKGVKIPEYKICLKYNIKYIVMNDEKIMSCKNLL